MSGQATSIREMQEKDIDSIIHYWLDADSAFLKGMGVEVSKIPGRKEWENLLMEQLNAPVEEKKSYCFIWLLDGKAVGHSNINKIQFGQEAYMHLHLWKGEVRKKGWGTEMVKRTLPYFFENFKLKNLYCEPYALNPAPNKTLAKVGFEFVRTYTTIPGWINFEQPVNRWQLSYERYCKMKLQG